MRSNFGVKIVKNKGLAVWLGMTFEHCSLAPDNLAFLVIKRYHIAGWYGDEFQTDAHLDNKSKLPSHHCYFQVPL